jgi:hypothetical protein
MQMAVVNEHRKNWVLNAKGNSEKYTISFKKLNFIVN